MRISFFAQLSHAKSEIYIWLVDSHAIWDKFAQLVYHIALKFWGSKFSWIVIFEDLVEIISRIWCTCTLHMYMLWAWHTSLAGLSTSRIRSSLQLSAKQHLLWKCLLGDSSLQIRQLSPGMKTVSHIKNFCWNIFMNDWKFAKFAKFAKLKTQENLAPYSIAHCTDDGPRIKTFAILIMNLLRLNSSKNHYILQIPIWLDTLQISLVAN